MLKRLTGLALGLVLMVAPAFAGPDCCDQASPKDGGAACCDEAKSKDGGAACCDEAKSKDGGAACCAGPDGAACEKACMEWNWAEESQATSCGDHVCPNDLAMQEGRQPKRWAAGNPNYGLTVRNDGCWPDHVENQPNKCRNNWNVGAWTGSW